MEEYKNISLTQSPEWGGGATQSIDFIVTEDCNLRCKYCYICHKKADKVMDFDTARKFIDYLFSDKFKREPGVILGFIGGEPFIEVELIDRIVDYFKIKSYMTGSDWWWNYRISITTNGLNYSSPEVQRFIKKNQDKISVTITIDGTKEKHDSQRVFPNGEGSYGIIEKNIPLYLSQFPGTTKVTFAHDDLPLLKESILHLWNIGINDISANVVFEDVWQDGDDEIFESQLKALADSMIDKELYIGNQVSLFDESIGRPLEDEHKTRTTCGAGKMLALGPSGKIYPCLRYKDYSLESGKEEITLGDADIGIDFNKLLRFKVSTYPMQCDDECMSCEIASGCSFCQGQSYDAAATPTNYERSKAICMMHKARVRANNYYFNRLYNEKNIRREIYKNEFKKMYFVLDTHFTDFCESSSMEYSSLNNKMDISIIKDGLQYCAHNFFTPVFLHSNTQPDISLFNSFNEHRITHIVLAQFYNQLKDQKNCLFVFDKDTVSIECTFQDFVILNVNWNDIGYLSEYVINLFSRTDRINLNLQGNKLDNDIALYEKELEKISDFLKKSWAEEGLLKEFNKITDVLFSSKQTSCKTGEYDLALAPNGEFYVCPFEYISKGNSIGNLQDGTLEVKNKRLYSLNYAPLCKSCPATQCTRCSFKNKNSTGEVNVPPEYKCQPSLIEYRVSSAFRKSILEIYPNMKFKELKSFDFKSPYEAYEHNIQALLEPAY